MHFTGALGQGVLPISTLYCTEPSKFKFSNIIYNSPEKNCKFSKMLKRLLFKKIEFITFDLHINKPKVTRILICRSKNYLQIEEVSTDQRSVQSADRKIIFRSKNFLQKEELSGDQRTICRLSVDQRIMEGLSQDQRNMC